MAVIRNITSDVLSLFRPDAPPTFPGDEVPISDERFAERAWPKSTWALVEPPGKGYVDASVEDAHIFLPAPEKAAAPSLPAPAEDTPTQDAEENAS